MTRFENVLFGLPLATGIIFIAVGALLYKFPPKSINFLYGYRTKNSMKTQERWDFAQIYAAKTIIKVGFILCFCCIFGEGRLCHTGGQRMRGAHTKAHVTDAMGSELGSHLGVTLQPA